MTVSEVIGIAMAVILAIFGGMAGLIKAMILNKWKQDREDAARDREDIRRTLGQIQSTQEKLLQGQDDLKGDLHEIDLRVTKLEAEHKIRSRCFLGGDE